MLSNRLFAQGYGAFVPSLRAVRFDFDGKAWQGQANITPTAFDPNIWTHLPANAAFCASAPIDWAQVQKVIDGASSLSVKPKLADEFATTGAVCWYAEKGDDIAQPLFVALRKSGKASPDTLNSLFDWAVSTNQEHLIELRGLRSQQAQFERQLSYAKTSLAEANNEKIDSKLSDEVKKAQEAWRVERKKNAQDNIVKLEKSLKTLNQALAKQKKKQKKQAKPLKQLL